MAIGGAGLGAGNLAALAPDLATIVTAWPSIPAAIRAAILALVQAATAEGA